MDFSISLSGELETTLAPGYWNSEMVDAGKGDAGGDCVVVEVSTSVSIIISVLSPRGAWDAVDSGDTTTWAWGGSL